MSREVKTYFAKQVMITIGSLVVDGAQDGDFVSIEPNGDGITRRVGAYGDVVRSVSPDETANISLTLFHQANGIQFCLDQFRKDQAGEDGTFSITIHDLTGGLLFNAETAWVVKPPTRSFGLEHPALEIPIATGAATWTH